MPPSITQINLAYHDKSITNMFKETRNMQMNFDWGPVHEQQVFS